MNKDMRDASDAAELIQRIYYFGEDGVYLNAAECLLMTRLLSEPDFHNRAIEAWENRFTPESGDSCN